MTQSPQVVQNDALCRECGGRCCQGSPGVWVDPQRFFALFFPDCRLTLEQLRPQLADLGLVLWENSGVAVPAPMSELCGCAFHSPTGCQLSAELRPCQCLALVPEEHTLSQAQGCFCKLPDDFHWDVARENWRRHWAAVDLDRAET